MCSHMMLSLPRPRAVLMGPQRLAPIVDHALDLLDVPLDGTVAVITAGWQEREDEDDELMAALGGRPGVNLRLHRRGDAVYDADQQLFTEHRAKQDQLKDLQDLYRRRLAHVMAAAAELQELSGDGSPYRPDLVQPQLSSAIDWVRRLDEEHLALTSAIAARFQAQFEPLERPAVQQQRQELLDILDGCQAIAIAGGHVAVLLNKLQLFGLGPALAGKPIVAWSAGAMVLTERLVLFHDTPPQGRGFAEVMSRGLGLMPDVVVLPHARRRLLLEHSQRIALFARRFLPNACIALDERCYISYFVGNLGSGMWRANEQARRLQPDGACVRMEEI